MNAKDLIDYLRSFPPDTPIYVNEGCCGDVPLDCDPMELFLPIGGETTKYLVIVGELGI